MAVMVDKETKESVPLTAFFNVDRLAKDVQSINDAGRGKFLSALGMGLAMARNYDSFNTPTHFRLMDLIAKFDKKIGDSGKDNSAVEKRRSDRWNMLFVAGMWFQDLWNYDFRRTERCIIPYGTQMGEISFCAYNTGVGWRQIVEDMHRVASTKEWFENVGRHKIWAGHKPVALPSDMSEQSGGCGSSCGCEPSESADTPAATTDEPASVPSIGGS